MDGQLDNTLLDKVLKYTSLLRKELRSLGAFVGWLPLGYGCPPSQTPAMDDTGTWEYDRAYRPLGPDAAFWFDRLDRSIVMFDVSLPFPFMS